LHVACCERISEAYLLPVIVRPTQHCPFVISGFRSDNGIEFVNREVARLLEKLRVEFTRSRPRRCNDNALVEAKNGAAMVRPERRRQLAVALVTIAVMAASALAPGQPVAIDDTIDRRGVQQPVVPHDDVVRPTPHFDPSR
jgi:transposase InsO family protein